MNIWQTKVNNQNRANTRCAHATLTTGGLLTTFTDVTGEMKPMCKEGIRLFRPKVDSPELTSIRPMLMENLDWKKSFQLVSTKW